MKVLLSLYLLWPFSCNWLVNAIFVEESYSEKCYPVYGCFPTSKPYSGHRRGLLPAPKSPYELNIKLILTTRLINDQVEDQILHNLVEPGTLNPYFNHYVPTKLITPGYLQGGGADWITKLTKILLFNEDCNVIFVNWHVASLSTYGQSTSNTRAVGAVAGEFLNRIRAYYGYNLDWVHIYGHSLGAHIAGYIGEYTKGAVGVITGLDPAGPLFEGTHPAVRLDYTDAKFVLALHTDAGSIIPYGHLGIVQAVGHVDLYPNGGAAQPGCKFRTVQFFKYITSTLSEIMTHVVACNHNRALELVLEWLSNTHCHMVGHRCASYRSYKAGSCPYCGYNTSYSSCVTLGTSYFTYSLPISGRYYFVTNGHKGFCRPDHTQMYYRY